MFEDKEWAKKDEDQMIAELYQKRTFSKHGWEFMMVSRKQMQFEGVNVSIPENRRATSLF
jgi:hypothetical protein